MLAAIATYFLRKALGWLVEGLEPENFELSLWSGEVVLRDLQVKGDALALLGLPIAVKSGKVALLRLRIPWRALGSDQVVVEICGLNVVAVPKNELDEFDPEAEQAAALAAKQAAVDALATPGGASGVGTDTSVTSDAAAATAADAAVSDEAPGLVASYITSIVDNCRVEITDTHIRLEDSSSSDLPFALGIELKILALESVDGEWNVITDAAVANKASDKGMIRKAVSVRNFGIYLDALDQPLRGGRATSRDYILQPCSIGVRLNFDDTIVGGTGPPRHVRSATPEISANLQWPHIGLHLQKTQYRHLINFGAFTSTYSLRFENRQHRPTKTVSEDPAAWWRYAIFSIRDNVCVELKKRSWSNLHVALKLRKEYVALYMLHDKSYAAHVGKRVVNDKNKVGKAELKAVEAKLTVEQVKAFRKHAHDKLREHRAERVAAGVENDSGGGSSVVGVLMSPLKSLGNLFSSDKEGEEGDGKESAEDEAKTATMPDSPGGSRGHTNLRGEISLTERESLRLTVLIGQLSVSLDNTTALTGIPSSTELSLDRITANFRQRDSGMRAELAMGSIQVGFMKTGRVTQVPEIIIGPGEYQHPALSFQPSIISGESGGSVGGGREGGGREGGGGAGGGLLQGRPTPGPIINVVYETSDNLGSSQEGRSEGDDHDEDVTESPAYFPIVAHLDVQVKRFHLVWSASFVESLTQFFTLESATERERDQVDAIVFTTVAEARRLRDVGEARAKDAMQSSSRIFISGIIETPDLVLAAPLPSPDPMSEPAWVQRSWLLVRLGTLTVESNEALPEILAHERVPSSPGGESKRSSSESTLAPKTLATYDKMDIVLEGTQILFFDAQRKMQGSLIDDISIEVEFERCLAQTTVETPGMRVAIRLPNTGINMSPATLRAVTAALESMSTEVEEHDILMAMANGTVLPDAHIVRASSPDSADAASSGNVTEVSKANDAAGGDEHVLRGDVLEDLRKARLEHGGADISTGTATVHLNDRLWLQKAVSMQISVIIGELRVNLIDNHLNAYGENESDLIISTLKIRSLNFKMLQRTYDMTILLELEHLSLSDRTAEMQRRNTGGGIDSAEASPQKYFITTDECVRSERQCNATYTMTEFQVCQSTGTFLKLRLLTTAPESPDYGDREQCRGSPNVSAQIGKLAIFVDGKRLVQLIDYTNKLQPAAEDAGAESSTLPVSDEEASAPAPVPAPSSSCGGGSASSAPPLVLDMDIDEIGVYFSGSPNALYFSELAHSNSIHSRVHVLGINANVVMGLEKLEAAFCVEDIQICDDTIMEGSAYKAILSKEHQHAEGLPLPRREAGENSSLLRSAQLRVASLLFSDESWLMPVCKAPRRHNIIAGTFLQFNVDPDSVEYPGFPMVIDVALSRLRVVYSARSITSVLAVINDHVAALLSPPADADADADAAAVAAAVAAETDPNAPGTMPLVRASIRGTLVVIPVSSFLDDYLALRISEISIGNGSLNYGFDVQPVPKHFNAFVLLPKKILHEDEEGDDDDRHHDHDGIHSAQADADIYDDESDATLSPADLSKFMLFLPSASRRGSAATELESNFDEDEFTDAEGDSMDDSDDDHEFTDAESTNSDDEEPESDGSTTSPKHSTLHVSHRLTKSLQRIDALEQRFQKRRREIVDQVQTEMSLFAVTIHGLRIDAHQHSLRAGSVPLLLPLELEVIAGLPAPRVSSNTRVGVWLSRLHLNVTTENLAFVNGLLANNLVEEPVLPESALLAPAVLTVSPSMSGGEHDAGGAAGAPPTWCAQVDRKWKQDTIVCLNLEGVEIGMAESLTVRESDAQDLPQRDDTHHLAVLDIGPLHVEYDMDSRQQSSKIILELDYLFLNESRPRREGQCHVADNGSCPRCKWDCGQAPCS